MYDASDFYRGYKDVNDFWLAKDRTRRRDDDRDR